MSISKTFSAAGTSFSLYRKPGESFSASMVTSGFSGTISFEKSFDGGQTWAPLSLQTLTTSTATIYSDTVQHTDGNAAQYRFNCIARSAGSVVCTANEALNVANTVKRVYTDAKVGGTAGFVVRAADNVFLTTCPQSITAGKLVYPLHNKKVGNIMSAFSLIGELTSAGGTVTVDAQLRSQVMTAGVVTDTLVASMTQVSATANAVLLESNTRVTGFLETIQPDRTYYVLITVTTGASCTITLGGVVIEVTEVVL